MHNLTVIIPTYNQDELLCEALQALEKQSDQRFFTIVCDNVSSDRTEEICKQSKLSDLTYIKETEFLSKADNWDRAICYSKTEYSMLHHSDDLLSPNAIQDILIAVSQNKDAGVIHGSRGLLLETGEFKNPSLSYPFRYLIEPKDNLLNFFMDLSIIGLTFKTELYKLNGRFDNSYTHLHDWDAFRRILEKSASFYIPESLGYWRMHPLPLKLEILSFKESLRILNLSSSISLLNTLCKAKLLNNIKKFLCRNPEIDNFIFEDQMKNLSVIPAYLSSDIFYPFLKFFIKLITNFIRVKSSIKLKLS